MDADISGKHSLSANKILKYVTIPALAVFIVALFMNSLPRELRLFLNIILLAGIYGIIMRVLISSLVSNKRRNPPEVELENLPGISIIIPAYNEEVVLPETIESCIDVDYPAEFLEVIVSYESGSTDNTRKIAKTYEKKYAPVRARKHASKPGGKAKNVNSALNSTSGEIIAVLDADQRLDLNSLRRAVKWFQHDQNIWCVRGRCYGVNPEDSLITAFATVERHISEMEIYARDLLNSFNIYSGGHVFFRKKVFSEIGYLNEDIFLEDIDMASRIQRQGKSIWIDPGILTYEQNPQNLLSWWNQRKRWIRGWFQVSSNYLKKLPHCPQLGIRKKLDGIMTLSYVIFPPLTAILLPVTIIWLFFESITTSQFNLLAVAWTSLFFAPLAITYPIYIRDRISGLKHSRIEYIVPFVYWFYLLAELCVFIVSAFNEISGAKRVFIKTDRIPEASEEEIYAE